MDKAIFQNELDRLRAPFPLAAHSIREGNKVRGGQGIQWFVYIEKTEVENRLNEVFPGEWGSTVPVLTVMGNSIAATIGITIRGITRGNTGEDSNGTEKAKGATTDAFRRAAADWGVAKYLWEMDFQIYTDTYPDKDWKARDAKADEAFSKFETWYNNKFKNQPPPNVTKLNEQQSAGDASKTNEKADLSAKAAGDYEPQATTPERAKAALNGHGHKDGQKKGSDKPLEWFAASVTVKKDRNSKPYLIYNCQEGQATGRGRDPLRKAGYPCEDWTVEGLTYELTPPAVVVVQKNGDYHNVIDVQTTAKMEF